MTSAEVGPPSSIVAAWMTQRAGIVARGRLDRLAQADGRALLALALHRRPPARAIAPATPPPWSSCVFAALAIASTSSVVMSAIEDLDDGGHRGAS